MQYNMVSTVTFSSALRFWLKLGCISFGGPTGQIAIMHRELVENRAWISERRFMHALNYCMLLPGPEAQQLATYIGWLLHGVRGGLAAGALFVLPSLLVLIALSWMYLAFDNVPAVAAVLYGVKPAVVAIVVCAAYRIGSRVLGNAVLWATASGALVALFFLRLPFPLVVLGAGVIGWIGGRIAPDKFRARPQMHSAIAARRPALIDDDTPSPAHARFAWSRVAAFASVGLALWLAGMGALLALFDWHSTFAQMGWFFSKAALVTFGGAYAVLPYVQQAAVDQYAWLTPAQIIDGLALGETTPGPLIMVVAFVGFVGAWTQAALGPDALALAGVVGALVATFFTFLPSFFFILVGGPAVEATRDDLKFTTPLTAITAAVVGVILNLALYFAYHVFLPEGWSSTLSGVDWYALAICAAACFALVKLQINVMWVIAGCAAAGAVGKWAMLSMALI